MVVMETIYWMNSTYRDDMLVHRGHRDDKLGQKWSSRRYTGWVLVTMTIYWFSTGHRGDILGQKGSPTRYTGSLVVNEMIYWFSSGTMMIYWVKSGHRDDILVQDWSSWRYTGSVIGRGLQAPPGTPYWGLIMDSRLITEFIQAQPTTTREKSRIFT